MAVAVCSNSIPECITHGAWIRDGSVIMLKMTYRFCAA